MNANCETIKREMSEASVAELRGAKFDAHLSTCPECRQYREELLELSGQLGELRFSAPSDIYPRIDALLPRRNPASMRKLLLVFAIFIISVAVAGTSWYYVFGPGSCYVESPGGGNQVKTGANQRTGPPGREKLKPWQRAPNRN